MGRAVSGLEPGSVGGSPPPAIGPRTLRAGNQRLYQAFDRVRPGLDGWVKAERGEGFAGFGGDGGEFDLREFLDGFRQVEPGMEAFHCGAAAKRDPVRATLQ